MASRLRRHIAPVAAFGVSVASVLVASHRPRLAGHRLGRSVVAAVGVLGFAVGVNECTGKPVMWLRWSYVRFLIGLRHMGANWQVGDGREEALAEYVCARARNGDVEDTIRVIDDFCRTKSYLINVGDEKGAILDAAVAATCPRLVLELGTYCGYSALRIVRSMPVDAKLYSIEFNPANAVVARRIWDHAGVGDRATVVVGTLGDYGKTLTTLRVEHALVPESVDLIFLDHAKEEYLPDLQRILDAGWLHRGSVVVADNVKYPGAPEYRAYMHREEGMTWHTREHRSHAEYQRVIKDLVLESVYLGETD